MSSAVRRPFCLGLNPDGCQPGFSDRPGSCSASCRSPEPGGDVGTESRFRNFIQSTKTICMRGFQTLTEVRLS